MHFSTILLVALASAVASAAPKHKKRPCTSAHPVGTKDIHLITTDGVHVNQDVTFSIPRGADGPCSLITTFPAEVIYDKDGVSGEGPIVGLFAPHSDSTTPTYQKMDSFPCKEIMKFTLTLTGSGDGPVYFLETAGAGFALTCNCDN
ncbi:hypothetical protein B0H63DRAFT_451777 [Podospora didyma]|uniref:Ubiquitin 3 binding protein But2 C-terminal domain-containing protein n=1 Tax=Podospora didyma TaxID=330526 RepID=A0AAE0KJK5_9PEZI|nr:hypothetical protein B0H63DRAFT_451777 [Podospora didyma]